MARYRIEARHTFERKRDISEVVTRISACKAYLIDFCMSHGKTHAWTMEKAARMSEQLALPLNPAAGGVQPYYALDLDDDGIVIQKIED